MKLLPGGATDQGQVRDTNEDGYVVDRRLQLFAIADGMGGHRAGDVASKLATEAIVDFFRATATEDFTWPFHFDARLSEEENRLLTGIRIANRQIVDRSARSREFHGMGTTVVGCLFSSRKKKMYIGHVGDSRAYRVRGGQIKQMTRDHSLVNDYLLAMPELTEEQRSELPKNVITRALGMQEHVSVDLQADDAQVGDSYILCSDGLSGMIEDDEILALVQSSFELPDVCRKLIALANEHGGEDNITAVVVRIDAGAEDGAGLSDTLPTPSAAPRAPQGSLPDVTADTPPAGAVTPKSDPKV